MSAIGKTPMIAMKNGRPNMNNHRHDWAEYVYQSDMTEKLYEVTTLVYELVDLMLDNPTLPLTSSIYSPYLKRMKKSVEDDVKQIREANDE